MLSVIMINHSAVTFRVTPGMRVAQLVIKKVVPNVRMLEVEEFDETERGEGGLGSTGL